MSDRKSLELLAAIAEEPEDDEVRLEFARAIRPRDPEWADFVELQVGRARVRREKGLDYGDSLAEEGHIKFNGKRWAQAIASDVGRIKFDRGFPASVSVEPRHFLEHGARIIRQAPIRHIRFSRPKHGAFPLDELLASPLLEHFDSVELSMLGMNDEDVARIAASPHLVRCLTLDLSGNDLGLPAFDALAASPWARGLLNLERSPEAGFRAAVYFPGELWQPTEADNQWGAPVYDWTPLSPEGQALERKYGYVPWLHPSDNACHWFDARWYVDRGILPVKPAGTPVDP